MVCFLQSRNERVLQLISVRMTDSATFRQCGEEKGEANNTQETLHSDANYYANSNIQCQM